MAWGRDHQVRSIIGQDWLHKHLTDGGVGVGNLEISYWNQYLGQEIVLGSTTAAENHTVNWDTRGLPSATYAIRVLASDAIGNWRRAEVSVHVGDPDDQDPDGDGHENLIELALGTPRLESNPGTVLTTFEQVGEARYLQLNVAKNPLATNLIYRAEVAGSPTSLGSVRALKHFPIEEDAFVLLRGPTRMALT
ncbi:MAG: hypothetical protein ACK5CW_06910 [Verrucomicrobiota bacterium]